MEAAIITIGDELLYGQTVDTNAAWMGQRLAEIGIKVRQKRSVGDDAHDIVVALNDVSTFASLVLITGGLGPTKDDITKHTLARYFDTELVVNEEILGLLEQYFKKRGLQMLQSNIDQAKLPASCTPLRNERGTAWGMWFEKDGIVYVSMPGVPREMEALMTQEVLPRVKEKFDLPVIMHRHILTAGIGESYLAEKIRDLEDYLPKEIKLAYLPGMGSVKLRLTVRGTNRDELESLMLEQTTAFVSRMERYVYGFDNDVFEEAVGKLLLAQGKTISTAESCTGGYIAAMLASVPGASRYFEGSTVTYSYESKKNLLGVPEETLNTYGAVSEETVRAMVTGVCRVMGTDVGIATSGIAGPGGGTPDKPVGTVWVAVGSAEHIVTRKYEFPGNREQNIHLTAVMALELMRKYLKGLVS